MATTVVCLKMEKGEIVQDCDIYIGRKNTQGGWDLPESDYANPFKGERAVIAYYRWCLAPEQKAFRHKVRKELKGKVLGCWCKGKKGHLSCHGDVLAYICDRVKSKDLEEVIARDRDERLDIERCFQISPPDPGSIRDKIEGMLAGIFVGDTMGSRYEFNRSGKGQFDRKITQPLILQNRYTGSTKCALGQVTDDSEMTIIIANHLINQFDQKKQPYDAEKIVLDYMEWANGQTMVGVNTRGLFKGVKTLNGYQKRYQKKFGQKPPLNSDKFNETESSHQQMSNGSLMRSAPLALLADNVYAKRDVWLTNPSSVVIAIELDYLDAIRLALSGHSPEEVWQHLLTKINESKDMPSELKSIYDDIIKGKRRRLTNIKEGDKFIEGKGSAMSAMYCALSCLYQMTQDSNKSYLDLIEWVVKEHPKSDSDTNAAVTGALIGSFQGLAKMSQDVDFGAALTLVLDYTQQTDIPRPYRYHPCKMYYIAQRLTEIYEGS